MPRLKGPIIAPSKEPCAPNRTTMTNDQPTRDLLTRFDLRAEDLLELEGITESSDATAFLSGSLVERMGNATSDLDIFVVGAAEPRGEHIHRMGEAVFS